MSEKTFYYPGQDRLHVQARLVSEVVKRILQHRGGIRVSRTPVVKKMPITSFMDRMRISGLSKFDERTYIGIINFYQDEESRKEEYCSGALIVYVPENYIDRLLRALDYPLGEGDLDEMMEDACGTFCNLVAGAFKKGLRQLGYRDLCMSHFSTYVNDVLEGVSYDTEETEIYQIEFDINGEKSIVVDLTMGKIAHEDDIDIGPKKKRR